MKNITNYILENISNDSKKSIVAFEYDDKFFTLTDISDAIFSVFQEWEDDSEGWDPPFKTKNAMKGNKSVTDVFDYYGDDTWDDLYKKLEIQDSYKNKLKDFCYDNDKEITKILKKTISDPKEYRLRLQGKYRIYRCSVATNYKYNSRGYKYFWNDYTTNDWKKSVEQDRNLIEAGCWVVMNNKDYDGDYTNVDDIVAWHEKDDFKPIDFIEYWIGPISFWILKYEYSKNPDKYKEMLKKHDVTPTTKDEFYKLEKTKQ